MLSRAAQLLGLAAARNGQAMVAAACLPLSSALSRGLSSAQPEQPELNIVAPPVRLAGLQGRLASAVWSAATATNQMDKVASDMAFLKELAGDPEFNFFLKDPFLPREEKVSKMHELMAETGMSDISKNLISTMAETNSLKLLPKVTQGFDKIMTHIRGDVDCTVVTARPLSDAEKTQIENSLREMVKAKQKLQMTVVEDPSIMGGMIFKLGDKLIDCSIKTRLSELELMIMEDTA